MERFLILLKSSIRGGTVKGWHGFVWMSKIVLPISFLTVLLDHSGLLGQMDGVLGPMMGWIHLPATAALPLVVGLLTGIYGAIAAMSVLPLTVDQMTLIVVFLLIAHNLIQEGVVQHQSGFPFWMATVVRLLAAVLTVFLMGLYFGPDTARNVAVSGSEAIRPAFWPTMKVWIVDMGWLSFKILLIITVLMIVMEILRRTSFIEKMMQFAGPLLWVMGLDRQVGMLWMTASVFGITYGGAVIVEETREHALSPEQLKPLHVSIGINHAMIEDPSLFLSFGIHPFWLWIPRLAVAMMFTHLYRLWQRVQKKRRSIDVTPAPAGGQ